MAQPGPARVFDRSLVEGPIGPAVWKIAWPTMLQNVIAGMQGVIDHAMVNPPIPPWFWRGVNNNQNALYLECFVDELAHAAGQDAHRCQCRRKACFHGSIRRPSRLAVERGGHDDDR